MNRYVVTLHGSLTLMEWKCEFEQSSDEMAIRYCQSALPRCSAAQQAEAAHLFRLGDREERVASFNIHFTHSVERRS